MTRLIALLAVIVAVALVSCGRVMAPPVCVEPVVVDTVWSYNEARTDSVAALVTRCRRWE